MTEQEVGAFLGQQETGVLSTCADGDAYGIPESFGYRDGRLYFELSLPPDSRKREFIEQTTTVSFTVYEARTSSDFASVVVQGQLTQLSEDSHEAALAVGENEQFPSSNVFPQRDGESIQAYELQIEEITGKKGPEFDIETAAAEMPSIAKPGTVESAPHD